TNHSPAACKTLLTPNATGYVPDLGTACLSEVVPSDSGTRCFRIGSYPVDACFRMFEGRYGPNGPGNACAADADCTAPAGGTSKCFGMRCQWQLPGKAGDAPCVGNAYANG